ncbi:MAG: poly-gamma-glutamate hydrolase family protein [Deltaproteobacteria bacterium]|nr:poly-gamma-glutamate hydrolase family protein [Deltaproteobacteria bacterium]
MDSYRHFEHLKEFEKEGVDYRIRWRVEDSGIAILSIHGGDIEPGTSEIADAIAGSDHTFYTFEGMKRAGNRALHLTSTVFNEPIGLEIVCLSEIILSIHGCHETEALVYLGGMDLELREHIRQHLAGAGFDAVDNCGSKYPGRDPANICNICGRGMGIQLEISRGLRAQLFKDLTPRGRSFPTEGLIRFARAIQDALEPFKLPVPAFVCEGLD